MVPISRGKQVAGIAGAVVIGYTLSWLLTPAPFTGPVEHFGRTFGPRMAPVIVSPAPNPQTGDGGSIDASQPLISSPKALQRGAYEPI
jgi:hypothetical protein